jgi:indolepyruvate ferredoxin oxidoreductase beta subunit
MSDKMRIQMIISGVGGQGVLFATRIFSTMALREGYPLIGSETHGMSQRGGSVITHLKIGEFDSPLVRKGSADVLFALERNEAYKTLSFVKQAIHDSRGGLCFVNAPDPGFMDHRIQEYLRERDIEIHVFPADRLAQEMGSLRSANIALIGFACGHSRLPFAHTKVRAAIETIAPVRFQDTSLKIFDKSLVEGQRLLGT